MDESQFRNQLMTIFALRSGGGSSNEKTGSNGMEGLYALIYIMFMMSFIDMIIKSVKFIGVSGKDYITEKMKKKTANLGMPLKSLTGKPISSIIYERHYNGGTSDTQEVVDALLDYITNLDNTLRIKFRNRYFINNKNEFNITPDIKIKMIDIQLNQDNDVSFLSFEVFSESLSLSELKGWVNDIHSNYRIKNQNKLGDKKYYFNEIPISIPKNIDGSYRMETAPKKLTFGMVPFDTSKSLNNLFGEHIRKVRDKVEHFTGNPKWYFEKGIPYTLGILLHGPPGCGKTSLIKAIAKDTNRHIIAISLRNTTTQSQLNELFYRENIEISNGTIKTVVNIPLNQRVYILEDIDCLTSVVLERGQNSLSEFSQENALHFRSQNEKISGDSECITLSYLLNLLDGVLETPGRILVMTTNYPEKLDKALIRPGRIDLNIHFGKATSKMIKEFIEFFYSVGFDVPEDWNCVLTPAEVSQICSIHYNDFDSGIAEIKNRIEMLKSIDTFETKIDFDNKEDNVAEIIKEEIKKVSGTVESDEGIFQKMIGVEIDEEKTQTFYQNINEVEAKLQEKMKEYNFPKPGENDGTGESNYKRFVHYVKETEELKPVYDPVEFNTIMERYKHDTVETGDFSERDMFKNLGLPGDEKMNNFAAIDADPMTSELDKMFEYNRIQTDKNPLKAVKELNFII
jgi:DNA polymerase III delta prime subunit